MAPSGGEALILVGTRNLEAERVTFRFDSRRLGLGPSAAFDEETGEALELVGGRLELWLEGFGVRIVRLR